MSGGLFWVLNGRLDGIMNRWLIRVDWRLYGILNRRLNWGMNGEFHGVLDRRLDWEVHRGFRSILDRRSWLRGGSVGLRGS
jgi:hypothetical protein